MAGDESKGRGRRDERNERKTRLLKKYSKVNRGAKFAALGIILFAFGCGKDQPDSYPLTGKDGAPLTSAEAKAIADAHSPDGKKAAPTPEEITAMADKKKKDLQQMKETPSESQVGIPFYPGAEPRKNKGDLPLTTESDNALLLTLETADPMTKVDAFYKTKLPLAHRLQETIAGKQTIGYVDSSEPRRNRSVDISADGDKTVIALIVTRSPKDAMPTGSAPTNPASSPGLMPAAAPANDAATGK